MPRQDPWGFVNEADAPIERCLFCGRKGHQTRNAVDDPRDRRYWISCAAARKCGAEGPKRKTARGAIAAWNRAHLGMIMGRGTNIDDYDDD